MSQFNTRSIHDQTIYTQKTPPDDERTGIHWVDTSQDPPVLKQWSESKTDWIRVVTVYRGPDQPDPDVIELWVDESTSPAKTKTYDESTGTWEGVAPSKVQPTSISGGYVASYSESWTLYSGNTYNHSIEERPSDHHPSNDTYNDGVDITVNTTSGTTYDELRVYVGGDLIHTHGPFTSNYTKTLNYNGNDDLLRVEIDLTTSSWSGTKDYSVTAEWHYQVVNRHSHQIP